MYSGDDHSIPNDDYITTKFNDASLGGLLIKSGYSFSEYFEDMPSVGYMCPNYNSYADRHNPIKNFSDTPDSSNQPFSNFPAGYAGQSANANDMKGFWNN